MKLNWTLMREILAALEEKPVAEEFLRPAAFANVDEHVVSRHIDLLREGGLISAKCINVPGQPVWCVAQDLTLEGYELLGKMRGRGVWDAVVKTARERGIDLTLDVVKALATRLFQEHLK